MHMHLGATIYHPTYPYSFNMLCMCNMNVSYVGVSQDLAAVDHLVEVGGVKVRREV